jgi:hypothetical protein
MANEEAKQAKAEADAAKARAKALRPWYKKKRVLFPLVILVIGVIAAAGGGGGDDKGDTRVAVPAGVESLSSNTKNPPQNDVAVTQCAAGRFGPDVKVRITNNTSKRSNYMVSLNLETADGTKVGEGSAMSNNIDPGQVAEEDVFATSSGEFAKCTVKNVERFAS